MSISAVAAARAAHWLSTAWRDCPGDAVMAVDALALARICCLLDPDSAQVLHDLAGMLAQCATPAWSAADLLSGLIAAGTALCVPGTLALSAAEYVQLVGELRSEAEGANGVLVHLALHGGDPDALSKGPIADAPVDVGLLCSGRREDVARLLSLTETMTAFGSIKRSFGQPLAAMLEGAAMAALRAYDLPLAMRLLRSRVYVDGSRSLALATAFDFLRLCQCDDGSFGDFDTALAQMAARGERHGTCRIKLPVTWQALWTMAELEDPSFRLGRDAFAGVEALQLSERLRDADEGTDRVVQA